MKGLIIYQKQDYKRNCDYIKWMCEVAEKKGCFLQFMFLEDFFAKGLDPHIDVNFVINRSRSYEASLIFELNNIRVFNNSCVTLLGNNKLAAYKYAKDKGYNFAEVYVSWKDRNNVLSKPNRGHGGIGISMLEDVSGGDWDERLQQKYIENAVGDARFYIIANKIVHAVLRRSNGRLISNYSRGGSCEIFKYDSSQEKLVKSFIEGISIDYAGVDFLVTNDGELIFNEIEDVVGSRMLSHLGINNTTELYIDHIVSELGD